MTTLGPSAKGWIQSSSHILGLWVVVPCEHARVLVAGDLHQLVQLELLRQATCGLVAEIVEVEVDQHGVCREVSNDALC